MGSAASRDLGLARIGRVTRFMAAGVILGGAALSAAAAKALPGHNGHPTSAQTSGGTNTGTSTGGAATTGPAAPSPGASSGAAGSDQSGGSASLTPPTQAPQPVYTPPVVNSGGS